MNGKIRDVFNYYYLSKHIIFCTVYIVCTVYVFILCMMLNNHRINDMGQICINILYFILDLSTFFIIYYLR